MSRKLNYENETEQLRDRITSSAFYDRSMEPILLRMRPIQLETLAKELELAQSGGGLIVDKSFSFTHIVTRVEPTGVMVVSEPYQSMKYSGVSYVAQFDPIDGKLHTLSTKSVDAEICFNDLLVCSRSNDRRTVARFDTTKDEVLELKNVSFDYGYTSGVVKSGPGGFMPQPRQAIHLDHLSVDTSGEATYRFNIGKSEKVPTNNLTWFNITGQPFQHMLTVNSKVGEEQLRVQITDGRLLKDQQVPDVFVNPGVVTPMSVRTPTGNIKDLEIKDDLKLTEFQLDTVAKQLEMAAPKTIAAVADTVL